MFFFLIKIFTNIRSEAINYLDEEAIHRQELQNIAPTLDGTCLVFNTSSGQTIVPARFKTNYNGTTKSRSKNKAKRVTWNSAEIECMLNIFKEKGILNIIDGNKYRSLDIYRSVVADMAIAGYIRSAEQIRTKMRLLRAAFLKCKKHLNTSGAGADVFENQDDEDEEDDCDFYELLKDIYGARPTAKANNNGLESSEFTETGEIPIDIDQDLDLSQQNTTPTAETQPNVNPSSSKYEYKSIKKRKNDWDEYRKIEDDLMNKNHEFWGEEYNKQRQFENEQRNIFQADLQNNMKMFLGQIPIILNQQQPQTPVSNNHYQSSSYQIPFASPYFQHSQFMDQQYLASQAEASKNLPYYTNGYPHQSSEPIRNSDSINTSTRTSPEHIPVTTTRSPQTNSSIEL